MFFNGKCVQIGTLLTEKTGIANPKEVCVAYHSLKAEPSVARPDFMTFTLLHKLVFQLADVPLIDAVKQEDPNSPDNTQTQKTCQQQHAAGLLPPTAFATDYTGVIWTCRFATGKGFQPVRPMVIFTKPLTLKGRSAFELTKSQTGS